MKGICAFTGLLLLAAGCYSPPEPTYTTYYEPPVIGQGAGASAIVISDADRALAERVRAQFNRYGDLATLASDVQVSARNGMVTLTGSVPTEQERRMIIAMVENTPGVTVVTDLLQPSGVLASTPSDVLLANRVREALRADPATAPHAPNIHINARNGTVTLTGTVPDAADKSLIESVAQETAGVLSVIDNTRVSILPTGRGDRVRDLPPADSSDLFNLHVQGLNKTDRALAQRVLNGLRTDAMVTAMLPVVNIHVDDGRVILRGTVANEEQRRTIISAVQRAAGPNNVLDELRVQDPR